MSTTTEKNNQLDCVENEPQMLLRLGTIAYAYLNFEGGESVSGADLISLIAHNARMDGFGQLDPARALELCSRYQIAPEDCGYREAAAENGD